jgi:hypothetical protein
MSSITLRLCTEADDSGLRELAGRDSARPLIPGAILAAECDGRILAALCLREGRVIADPFARTAELVELLRLRALQLRGERRGDRLRVRLVRSQRRAIRETARSPVPGRAPA